MSQVLVVVIIPKKEFEYDLKNPPPPSDSIINRTSKYIKTEPSIDADRTSAVVNNGGGGLTTIDEQNNHHEKPSQNGGGLPTGNKMAANFARSISTGLSKDYKDPKDGLMKDNNAKNVETLEKILDDALRDLAIDDSTWVPSRNNLFWQVYFPCEMAESDGILQYLSGRGIGNKLESSIGIIPFSLYYQNDEAEDDYDDVFDDGKFVAGDTGKGGGGMSKFKQMQQEFLRSVTARMTVAQVVQSVEAGAAINFDFIMYIIFAAWIAAMGLLDNSVVSTVASMLVSPMMGPVMALTFGTLINNSQLRNQGIRNYCWCLLICVAFGFSYGLICMNFTQQWNPQTSWPTEEMASRGRLRVLWVGSLVALPSGGAIAVALLSGNQATIVGVAISASLLPPCVNAGLHFAYAAILSLRSLSEEIDPVDHLTPSLRLNAKYVANEMKWYSDNAVIESTVSAFVSMGLSIVNVICIFIMACIVLKIKEIAPLRNMAPATRRFFHEDIKIARKYNANRKQTGTTPEAMGEDILREWAKMTGIDEKELLSDRPEARVTQMQTLQDLVQDIEEDETYRSIVRGRGDVDVVRRMSMAQLSPAPFGPGGRTPSYGSWRRQESVMGDVEANGATNVRRASNYLGAGSYIRRSGGRGGQRFFPQSSMLSNKKTDSTADLTGSAGELHHREQHRSDGAMDEVQLRVVPGQHESHSEPSSAQALAAARRRKSSVALRKSLQFAEHAPYSLWPMQRSDSRDHPTSAARGRSGSTFGLGTAATGYVGPAGMGNNGGGSRFQVQSVSPPGEGNVSVGGTTQSALARRRQSRVARLSSSSDHQTRM